MSRAIKLGSADQSVIIRIVDSTDGTPETGVTSATSGLALFYRREGGAEVALTESDLAAVDSAHSDGGMKHIRAGLYRVDPPDAAFASGATGVMVYGECTGMVVIGSYHPLVALDSSNAGYQTMGNDYIGLGSLLACDLYAIMGNSSRAEALEALVLEHAANGKLGAQVKGIDANAITAASIATGAFTAAKFAADFFTASAAATWNALTAGITTANSIGKRILDFVTTLVYTTPPTPPTAAAIASLVESALINDGDGQTFVDAMVQSLDHLDVDELALVALFRADIERSGGNLNTLLARNNPLDAAATRAALGLASANLDTQLGGIVTTQTAHTTSLTSLSGVIVTKLNTMLVLSGAGPNYQFTADAVENAPAGEGGGGGGGIGTGTGDTPIDHNTGGVDALQVKVGGQGIGNASITAYLATDYALDASTAVRRGQTFTDDDGRWTQPLMLDAGLTYRIVVFKSGYVSHSFAVEVPGGD